MEYIVETKGLTKRYGGKEVVKDVDLKVPKAHVYGFMGPNGAGKSTTLNIGVAGHVSEINLCIQIANLAQNLLDETEDFTEYLASDKFDNARHRDIWMITMNMDNVREEVIEETTMARTMRLNGIKIG